MSNFGDNFYEAFMSSSVIQGAISLVVIVTVCYLYATGASVPDALWGILTLVIGYYFGSKTQQRINRDVTK